jgi:hypothetical protein
LNRLNSNVYIQKVKTVNTGATGGEARVKVVAAAAAAAAAAREDSMSTSSVKVKGGHT